MAKKKIEVTEKDKNIILSLAKAGVTTPVIAQAWGIPPQAVAAYKAWETMRG